MGMSLPVPSTVVQPVPTAAVPPQKMRPTLDDVFYIKTIVIKMSRFIKRVCLNAIFTNNFLCKESSHKKNTCIKEYY